MFPPCPPPDPAVPSDVRAGPSPPLPAIPARWLSDRRGSDLFEKITELPEYYPPRTERALLERHCADVARIAGKGDAVIEFGSGSSTKTPILLRALAPAAYVPIDKSGDFLRDASAAFQADFPGLPFHPVSSEEHTSELQSLITLSFSLFYLSIQFFTS